MNTVILVPRRADHGHRDAVWAFCRARWEAHFPDLRIFEGHHDEGLFNRSAAVNRAAQAAGDWDIALVIDADVMVRVSQVRAALATADRTGRVTWAHRRWSGIPQGESAHIIDGAQLDAELSGIGRLVARTNPISWSCCIAVPRKVFDDIGGFDERFKGWGWEDMAFQSLIVGLYGHERIEGDVYHLWHPRSPERVYTPAFVANARLGRRYMVALRRDHGKHDRIDAGPEDLSQDVANLLRDDAKLSRRARRLGMPDWDSWWPTLAELRDGAKTGVAGPGPTISVVMHSGGNADAWSVRSEYLRKALASFSARVSGPIVQRVIFSDWANQRELDEIASERGFYVVGGGHRGYTDSMRAMWSYISRKARGEYVFLIEDDFVYEQDINLAALVRVLDANSHLAQVALLRDAFYASEREKGGILGWPLEQFTPKRSNEHSWLEHDLFFTANPALFRRSLANVPWPRTPSSERVFGDRLTRSGQRYAFWGDGQNQIRHIGEVRAGASY